LSASPHWRIVGHRHHHRWRFIHAGGRRCPSPFIDLRQTPVGSSSSSEHNKGPWARDMADLPVGVNLFDKMPTQPTARQVWSDLLLWSFSVDSCATTMPLSAAGGRRLHHDGPGDPKCARLQHRQRTLVWRGIARCHTSLAFLQPRHWTGAYTDKKDLMLASPGSTSAQTRFHAEKKGGVFGGGSAYTSMSIGSLIPTT
jgi:hypothetical protein